MALHGLNPESVQEVIERVTRSAPKISFSHPFGYYEIPVLVPIFDQACIKSPVEIKFVDSSHEALQPHGKSKVPPIAIFNQPDRMVYLNQDHFTPINRLCGWIIRDEFGGPMYEELAEHEIRHGLFTLNVPPPYGGGIGNIDEGFARATQFSHPFDAKDPWIKGILSPYENDYLQPEEINGYQRLFNIAQAKGFNDVELLKYMAENDWWAGQTNEWYLYRPRVEGAVFKHIGYNRKLDILTPGFKQKQEQLADFRFKTWTVVHDYLISHGLELETDWNSAIEEAAQIRKAWKRHLAV